MTFDLAHTDLAGELQGADVEALQREGTVQRLLVTAPYLREGELLQHKCGEQTWAKRYRERKGKEDRAKREREGNEFKEMEKEK